MMRRNRLAALMLASALVAGGIPLMVGAQDDDAEAESGPPATSAEANIKAASRLRRIIHLSESSRVLLSVRTGT